MMSTRTKSTRTKSSGTKSSGTKSSGKRHLLLSAALFLSVPAVFAPAQDADPPAGEEAGEPVDRNAEAAEWLKELPKQIGKQTEEDAAASVKRLVEVWGDEAVLPATKKPVPGHLERYAKTSDFMPVAVAAVDGMGELGPDEGAKSALEVLEHALKEKQPSVDLYGACFRTLKKLADPSKKTVGALVKYIKYKDYDVIAKSADAMSGYRDAPGKVRKELFEELLKISEGIYSAAENTEGKRKWNTIGNSVMNAFRALAQGQAQFNDPGQARSWYNDNKKSKDLWS
jgi:hypothetical protein